MIQRIQTLFLVIAAGLLCSLFANDFMYAVDGSYAVSYTEYKPFMIFTFATFFLTAATVFMFKNRIMQIRLCIYGMLLLLGYQGWLAYSFFSRPEGTAFSITAVFPIVAAILTFIAMRYIARDEALVQSVNSLRHARRNKKPKKNAK